MISSGAEAADRKQRIRDRYKGVDTSELEVIPAKTVEGLGESTSIRRVAAYVRVSTDNDEQTSSYELQKNYYTDYIKAQPGWEFVGIYDDEGISGTSLEHRKGMQQLIEDCKAGKIDLILTKSIARFARNIVDCLSVIETLKNLDPPVGVKFEADNIYTLDSNGRMILTILASVAEEESQGFGVGRMTVQRFIRLTELIPPILQMVDEGKIALTPAVELSFLKKDEQENLFATMESEEATPSLSQAQRMKQLSQSGRLDMDTIFAIMTEEKGNQKETLKINTSKLKKYFPKNTTPKQMEETIIKLLERELQRKRGRDSR